MTIPVCSIVACVLILASRTLTQSPPNPVLDANKTAVKEIQNGNLVHAIQLLAEAVKRDSKNARIYYDLGSAYFLMRDFGNARSALSKALELEPNSAAVLNQLGLTQMEQGDYSGAVRSFRRAIDVRPDDPISLYNLGCLYIRTKDFRSAIELLERAERLDDTDPEISFNLAFAYGRNGDIPKAIDKARATLVLTPDDRDTREMIVILYLLNKKRTEALKELHSMEGWGSPIDPWLSRLVFGKRIVSIEDLRRK